MRKLPKKLQTNPTKGEVEKFASHTWINIRKLNCKI